MHESSSDEEDSELLSESKEQMEAEEEVDANAEAVEDEEPEEVVGMVMLHRFSVD